MEELGFIHNYYDSVVSGVRLRRCGCVSSNLDHHCTVLYSLTPAPSSVEVEARQPRKRARSEEPCPGGGIVEAPPFLSEDIIFNILCGLPVEVLSRFRLVCKRWRYLMADPRFVRRHAERRSKTDPCVLIWPFRDIARHYRIGLFACKLTGSVDGGGDGDRRSASAKLVFEADIDCIVDFEGGTGPQLPGVPRMPSHHCDGLLLFTTGNWIHVCNPTTGEFVTLPGIPAVFGIGIAAASSCKAALCRDPLTGEYKVVTCFCRRADYARRTYGICCVVLTLGGGPGTFSWRITKDNPPYPVMFETVVSSGGAVYWMIHNNLNSYPPQIIVSMDLRDERFSMISAPPALSPYDPPTMESKTLLRELGGKLCLAYTREDKGLLDIWVLGDRTSQVWTIKYSIQLPPGDLPIDLLGLHQGRVLVVTRARGLCYYDPDTKVLQEGIDVFNKLLYYHPRQGAFVSMPGVGGCQLCLYAESLVSIRG